jgi:autotransporter-associated beta strand protein
MFPAIRLTRRSRCALICACAACIVPATARSARAQTSGTWVGLSGNWSIPSNWNGNVVPDDGGAAAFALHPRMTGSFTVTQDRPNVTLGTIALDSPFVVRIEPSPATNTITLSGPATVHAEAGPAEREFNPGHVISVPIAGSAGLRKTGPGSVALAAPNSYLGGTTISGGRLRVSAGDAALGHLTGGIAIENATMRVDTTGFVTSRPIHVVGAGSIESRFTASLHGTISGNGTLTVSGSNIDIDGINPLIGPLDVRATSLTISRFGSFQNAPLFAVSGAMQLHAGGNRIGDGAGIEMRGGVLSLFGNDTTPYAETVGNGTFATGLGRWSVDTLENAPPTSLSASSIHRAGKGAAYFSATNLGAAPATGGGNIYLAQPPALVGGGGAAGSTDVSIIPWAYGNAGGNVDSLVTYDAHGLRPLNLASEYATALPAATPHANLRVGTVLIAAEPATVNALLLTSSASLRGPGTITVTSGAVVATGVGGVSAPLNFGPAEAIVHTSSSISLSGAIAGTGGLTKTSGGRLTLHSAESTYTGTTTITGGEVMFSTPLVASGAPGTFGADPSPIVIDPGGAGRVTLRYSGAGPGQFDRALHITGREGTGAIIGTSGTQTLALHGPVTLDTELSFVGVSASITINAPVSGAGSVNFSAPMTYNLAAPSTYAGGTSVSNGTFNLADDAAFGSGPVRVSSTTSFPDPTFIATGGPRVIPNDFVGTRGHAMIFAGGQPITFTGDFELSETFVHDVRSTAPLTYAGVLHTGELTKGGPGTLVLTGDNTFTGLTRVTAGVLRIEHPGALGTPLSETTLSGGATLQLGAGVVSPERVYVTNNGIPSGGAIRSLGGATGLAAVDMFGSGTIAVDSGALTVAGAIATRFGTPALTKTGPGELRAERIQVATLTVNAGTASVTPGRSALKTSRLSALTVATGARLDLGDNDLVIDYAAADPTPAVAARIASGFAGGTWDGDGIVTSEGDDALLGLGYARSSDVFTTFPATFSGQTVDSTALLLRFTFFGDANLDGTVNLQDFNRLAANFGASGKVWSQGDFNYDGLVNLADFNRLAANFGLAAAGPHVTPEDWAALAAAVPEPGAGALAMIGALLLRRVRRRHVGRR